MLQGCTPRWDLEGGPFPPGENVAPRRWVSSPLLREGDEPQANRSRSPGKITALLRWPRRRVRNRSLIHLIKPSVG